MSDEPDGVDAPAGIVALETAVNQSLAACDGDLPAAVRALVVTLDVTEAELEALRGEVARTEAAVSGGFVRRAMRRREPDEARRGTWTFLRPWVRRPVRVEMAHD